MKIHTPKKQFLDAILLAERITGKKESLPVLSCVLLEAQKDELVIRATNLEAGIEIRIQCEVEDIGVIAVPASILSQTIRSISSEKISLKAEDGNLLVESRGTKTLIKSIPHDEFPVLSREVAPIKGVSISRERLLRGLQAVSYATSPSMIRPELGSVYVSLKAVGMVCAATDSFRLAEKTIPGVASVDTGDILIPLKHVLELVYILERVASQEVAVQVEDFQLTVSSEGTRFISRVVDAQFPNYKDIIPKKSTTEATLLKNDFAEMLRKARVFSGTEQHVGIHIYPKKKIFSATARSSDVGEMSDSLEAALTGEDVDINFHIGYMGECLSSIDSDSITLSFAGVGRPLVIRGVGDASFMYLVMPLNK